jgi:asparagine synthetase B (glutamine-hydrolysing)
VTSRQAHVPVHVWSGDGTFVASTDFGRLLPFVPRPALDRRALDLFVRSGEFIDGLTHVEGVSFLPGGARLRAGAATPIRYWRFRHGASPAIDGDAAVAECVRLLRAAVRRVERAYPSIGIPLSGGLDSRLLLALCERPEAVPTLTWGTRDCRDLRYAAAFARAVGSRHQGFLLDPAAYPPLWASGVEATAGSVQVHNLVVLPFVARLAERADVMVDGLAGDAILGGNFLMRPWFEASSLGDLAAATWRWRVRPDEDAWADRLFRDADARGAGRAAWERSISAAGDGRPIERLVDWLLENRVFRTAKSGALVFRTRMEAYAPFFDRDLVDLLVRVPLESRYKHRMYLKVLRAASPAAARVRWQRTALPPSWGYAANLASMAAHRAVQTAAKPLGIRPFRKRAFYSPADWFRGPWAPAARALLLSERALDRGIFDPDAVRAMLDAHAAGRDYSSLVGNLLALELFQRRFLDGAGVAGGEGGR